MQFPRRIRTAVEVNLTPLIDVVFLLLIFFMVSTTFTQQTRIRVNLPESAEGQTAQNEVDHIEITITASGDYGINGLALLNNKPGTLKSALHKASQGDNKIPLYITADAQTPHQSVVAAYDAAGQLGFVTLNVTTRRRLEQDQ